MIHTARQSPKFIRLVRRLRPLIGDRCFLDADGVAIALLERLWHCAATGAIRGDIGRFDNEVIAESCGWPRDADELIDLLVSCGWLDECPKYRLLVHDWHDHAPNYVKGNVGKKGGFLTEGRPSPKAQPKGPAQGPSPKAQPQRMGAPNLTKPNQTKPKEEASASLSAEPTEVAPDGGRVEEQFQATWNATEGVRRIRKLNPKLRQSLKRRCGETVETDAGPLPWIEAFKLACRDKFPLPMTQGNPSGWLPDGEWILRPASLQAIWDGKYDFTPGAARGSPSVGDHNAQLAAEFLRRKRAQNGDRRDDSQSYHSPTFRLESQGH